MTRTRSRVVAVAAVALGAQLFAAPALAHVTANPNEADSPYFRTALRIGHGCEGSPTTTVRVQIPEGVSGARPEVVPGWEAVVVREDLAEPIEDGHGEPITDRVAELVWSGGELSDSHFQEFGLSLRIADDAPDVLWLPTIQECEDGEHRWIEIPPSVEEWGELDEPAPYVLVTSRDGDGDGDGDQATGADPAHENEGGMAAMPVAVAGLVAGLLGLGAGAFALIRGGRNAQP